MFFEVLPLEKKITRRKNTFKTGLKNKTNSFFLVFRKAEKCCKLQQVILDETPC